MVGGAKSHLESNTIPARDTWRDQTKPCVHQDPETPQRLSHNCVECLPVKVQTPQRLSHNCVECLPVKVQVSSGLPQGQGLWVQETWSHSLWDKPSRRRSPLILPQSRWADHPQIVEQLHQRNPCTAKNVLGSPKDSPTWGLGKGTKNPQGIWLWRPVGFDYRNYTRLWKQLLKGTNKTLCIPGPRRKEQWPHKRLTQTCLWMFRSLQERSGLVVACCSAGGAPSAAVHTQDSSKEVAVILNTSTILWSLLMGGAVYPPCYLLGAKLWWR